MSPRGGALKAVATVATADPAATSGARSAAARSGNGWRSTQAAEYAPDARPTSRQHQLKPPTQAAPAPIAPTAPLDLSIHKPS
jgi:hypothetical protein